MTRKVLLSFRSRILVSFRALMFPRRPEAGGEQCSLSELQEFLHL